MRKTTLTVGKGVRNQILTLLAIVVCCIPVRGQELAEEEIVVEWASFGSPRDSSIVFNLYHNHGTPVTAWYVPLPLDKIHADPQAQAFAHALGLNALPEILEQSPEPIPHGEDSTEIWSAALAYLMQNTTVHTDSAKILLREVNAHLVQTYTLSDEPSRDSPVFPHLRGGYPVVYSPDGQPASLPLTLRFDETRVGEWNLKLISIENLGNEPFSLSECPSFLRGWEFTGENRTVDPLDRVTLALRFEPGFLSFLYPFSRSAICYETDSGREKLLVLAGRSAGSNPVQVIHESWNTIVGLAREHVVYRVAFLVTVVGLAVLFLWAAIVWRDMFRILLPSRPIKISSPASLLSDRRRSVQAGGRTGAASPQFARMLAFTYRTCKTLLFTIGGALRRYVPLTLRYVDALSRKTVSRISPGPLNANERHQIAHTLAELGANGPATLSPEISKALRRLQKEIAARIKREAAPAFEDFQTFQAINNLLSIKNVQDVPLLYQNYLEQIQSWLTANAVETEKNEGSPPALDDLAQKTRRKKVLQESVGEVVWDATLNDPDLEKRVIR